MQQSDAFRSKSKQKILIFEFITGGGFSRQALPCSLAREGLLMLKALIADFNSQPNIQLTVVLDWRIEPLELPKNSKVISVAKDECVFEILPALIENIDMVWPIAPEFDSILQHITDLVENRSKTLLNSSAAAIELCSNKLFASHLLELYGIPTVKTISLALFSQEITAQWVIKPIDGAGCSNSYLLSNEKEFIQIIKQIDSKLDYIIQPFIEGQLFSLSCLFKNGKAWLLCCNRQVISVNKGCFQLDACLVNISSEHTKLYQMLIDRLAAVIPDLFGYVGIDIIHPQNEQPLVLDINPRLTTSYVGLYQAIGFNAGKAVLDMIEEDPIIQKTSDKQVSVSIL